MKLSKLLTGLISVGILIVLILYINPILLINTIIRANIKYILISLVLVNIEIFLRVLKWKVLLNDISFKELYPIQMFGMMVSNLTPGKIGEPIKAVLLKIVKNMHVSNTLPSIIWERIMDLTILLLLAIWSVVSFSNFIQIGIFGIIVFSIVIVLFLFGVSSKRFGLVFVKKLWKIKLFKKYISNSFIDSFYKTKIKQIKLLKCFLITLVTWILEGIVYYVVFLSVSGTHSTKMLLLFPSLLSISIVIGISSALPGGIGGMEAVFILLLISVGLERGIAASTIFLGRIVTMGYGSFIGFISFLYLNKKFKVSSLLRK